MQSTYGYNANHLLKDGKPWFPVMGEMHYSRYHKQLWEESLRKIKAGGVSIVSTYVIWIHHEEQEGIFDFTGCRDVGTFVKLCKKVGLSVFLRLGPFAHGEVRNGGFPDWILDKEKLGMKLRYNDEQYLSVTRRFWTKVYDQVKESLIEDDGPVIGIQIENEYGHVGGYRGPEGEAHIRTLTEMAREIGFTAPFYTATGWGGACIGDLLPVMGGYCEAPWDQRTTEIEACNNFVFSHTRNDELIACDHHVSNVNSYDETKFPFLTAELGGGLQVTSHRRPVSEGRDVGAMSTVKLGSGAALLGYYMYHGGSNPKGKLSTLQESKATGFLNDLPVINYDFNAPIRQYGTISDSYKEIKLLSYFLNEFGEDMAALKAEIPSARIVPGDMKTLRTTCRHDDTHGYVFFNNYQRRLHMEEHTDVELTGFFGPFDEDNILTNRAKTVFPKMTIKEGMYGFFPYQMKLGEATLKSALATPLCAIRNRDCITYIFYGNQDPQFCWINECPAEVLHISREDALNAWKISLDQDYLVIADNYVWEEDGEIRITGGENTKVQIFPEPNKGIKGFVKCGENGKFSIYERKIESKKPVITTELLERDNHKAVYEIKVSGVSDLQNDIEMNYDVILHLTYGGEHMNLFVGNHMINDHFYTGQEVLLRLGYFDFPETIRVEIYPLYQDDQIFLEKTPVYRDGCSCELIQVKLTEQFW